MATGIVSADTSPVHVVRDRGRAVEACNLAVGIPGQLQLNKSASHPSLKGWLVAFVGKI